MLLTTIVFCLFYVGAYIVLMPVAQLLFNDRIGLKARRPSVRHIGYILMAWIAIAVLISLLPDPSLANRVQHSLGGGTIASLIFLLATRAAGINHVSIGRFLLVNLLVVTGLGVANELLEAVLQWNDIMRTADSIDDTWYDLYANLLGIGVASAIIAFKWRRVPQPVH